MILRHLIQNDMEHIVIQDFTIIQFQASNIDICIIHLQLERIAIIIAKIL